METYFSFLMQHWLLSSLLILVLVLLTLNEWFHRSFGIPKINNQELVNILNHSGGHVLDIRPTPNFTKAHIIGAINIPQAEIKQRLNTIGKYKTKPVIVVCGNGNEAPKVCKLLKDSGFEKLFYLANGMQGWVQESMPTTHK